VTGDQKIFTHREVGNQFRLLEKNVQTLGNNIKKGRTRANVITRKLRDVAVLEGPASAELLELPLEGDEPAMEGDEDLDAETVE